MKINKSLIVILLMFLTACSRNSDTSGGGTPLPVDPAPTPTTYTDEQILTMVEQTSIKYFTDYAHPTCKLARERYHTDDPTNDQNTVTTGGSGFGLMTILAGVNAGYINRTEAVSRLSTAMTFLTKNVAKYHGAFPHWLDGNTGNTLQGTGGTADNGGDLVETAFLCEGLICVREFFKNSNDAIELDIANKADALWKGVDWNWYTQGGQNVLTWHWSPNYGFAINMKISGYNEALITYILAAASPTNSPLNIVAAYQQGWARNGAIKNGGSQYSLPVIFDYNGASGNVGPMFWAHYSFLGLDPNGLSDQYANYQSLTTNHAKIIYNYCVANPKGFSKYSSKNWGLTASYDPGNGGYLAHQPNNDNGVISPTAAISSIPYTPTESMTYLRYVYNENYSKYIGVCGPYDAYKSDNSWITPRYLAIDQGTIAPMVENYKNGFIWSLFMNAPDVKAGLIKLGFHSTKYGF